MISNIKDPVYASAAEDAWYERRMPKALRDALRNGPKQRLAELWYRVYLERGLAGALEDLSLTNSKATYEDYGPEHPEAALWVKELADREELQREAEHVYEFGQPFDAAGVPGRYSKD